MADEGGSSGWASSVCQRPAGRVLLKYAPLLLLLSPLRLARTALLSWLRLGAPSPCDGAANDRKH